MGTQNKKVKEEFEKQAKDFSDKRLTLNNEQYLKWILDSLDLNQAMHVLDVAAGTGILSRGIAPHVSKVISIDLSEHMIAEGRRQNELMKVTNIEYHSGDVEQLPYADKTFDLVVSRFAFHHFARPAEVLNQMKRVCKAKGSVGVIDMISSEDDYLFQQYNHYETLRDPSHTNALKQSQIMNLFHENDLEITVCETLAVQVHVDRWLELTKTDDETSQLIKNNLHEEISGKPIISGMSPFMQDNELMFKQKWVKIVGKRK